MSFRIIGAIIIISATTIMGYGVVADHRKEEICLHQLIRGLEFMYSELEYRLTPLPELCTMVAMHTTGQVSMLFGNLHKQFISQQSVDAACCMNAALEQTPKLPDIARRNLQILGNTLGRFDLQGQLCGIQSVRELCRRDLDGLSCNRDVRLRSYRTLGICAGIALVILFI